MICICNLSEKIKGFSHFETLDDIINELKLDLYFLGYEKYECFIVTIKIISETQIELSFEEYESEYIHECENNLLEFFTNISEEILYKPLGTGSVQLRNINNKKFNGTFNLIINEKTGK